jgi:hypothetical protein
MKTLTVVAACLVSFNSPSMRDAPIQDTRAAKPVEAKAKDVESVDAILAALYDVISGPAGQKRDWDRFRSLFIPEARLIAIQETKTGGAHARVMTPEDYVTRAGPFLEQRGFFEKEIARHADGFARITQVFSTYESKNKVDDEKPFARGINSIQLMNDGRRWWVVTIYWDQESPQHPIPAAFLPK